MDRKRPPHPSLHALMLTALLIHLVVPAAGVAWYLRLCRRMRSSGVPDPPEGQLLLVFFNYGGWLLVLLTALFWHWSGLATAGIMYLLLVAPWVMGAVAVQSFPQRASSAYHRVAFWAACIYVAAMCIMVPAVWWAPRQ